MIRRTLVAITLLAVCLTSGLWAYHRFLRPFRVAVVHFSDTDWAAWEAVASQTPYSLHRFEREQFDTVPLANFNLVVIRSMGMNLSDEQVARIKAARGRGTHFLVLLATNDRSRQQNSLPAEQQAAIQAYLEHGGEENLLGMLHYAAREIGHKDVEVPQLVEKPRTGFFHLGDALCETLEEYDALLAQRRPKLPADAPRVALFGAFLDPRDTPNREHADAMLKALESQGARVYPIFGAGSAIKLLTASRPDLVIAFPHGRLAAGNQATSILQQLNCPCISALSLLTDREKWAADERGLAGGFMSQSITTPEIDGAIEPIPITSIEPNERNIRVRTVIPDRLEKRVALALNWLKLRRKPNAEKRLVIVYYKAPGLAALSAEGLEVVPSLLNTLKRLQAEGYDLGNALPETPEALLELIQTKGKTLGQWAIGSYEKFLAEAGPEFVPAESYARWFRQALSEKRQQETIDLWGPLPGKQMVAQRDDKPCLVVSRIRLGNVVIMPQPTTGGGGEDEDEVASIHGTNQAVPHFYLGAYLWARFGFQADAIVHFGTHGSLEFTYGKSVCLSRDCWPDILIGDLPHIYPYVINNVGEAMIAKRRSGAVIVSHLTPPFTAAGLYGDLSALHDKIHAWETAEDPLLRQETQKTITEQVNRLNLAAELSIPAEELKQRPLTDSELQSLHNYIHRLKDHSILDGLHVLGRSYTQQQVHETAVQMLTPAAKDAVAQALGAAREPALAEKIDLLLRGLVDGVLDGQLTEETLFDPPTLAALRSQAAAADSPATSGKPPAAGKAAPRKQEPPSEKSAAPAAKLPETSTAGGKTSMPVADGSAADPLDASRIAEASLFWQQEGCARVRKLTDRKLQSQLYTLLQDVRHYAEALRGSPQRELDSFINALRGGYVAPSSGGDPIINPDSVPTGRNMYGIDAEQAPTDEAWRVGCRLAEELLARQQVEKGHYPQQIAFSLWGGEFIRDRGTAIAEILYLMGVRPVRNSRGAVYDVEVIPAAELGRPRIDVLVQTSGQFRDLGASRIALIDKAVQMVAELGDEPYPNFVRDGTAQTEQTLKQRGFAPKEARELATARIFGAANNRSYGTDIMGLVEKGNTWEDEQQIADRYVQNMGGIYRNEATWGTYREGLFEAQMQGTEVVVHPRSSNTWGPLSLDHVYEFMGGMSLAVRAKTGVDPTGYFSDLRQRGAARLTTSVGAIREEARTTIWNPKFLRGMQREASSAAANLTESVRNMYGWNVMQPSAISQDMWDETYAVFLDDKHKLGMREYFEKKNPYALQDLTSIMLETARKGYWTPSEQVLQQLAQTHVELVQEFGAGCSYETCGNGELQEFIRSQLVAPGSQAPPEILASYQSALAAALSSSTPLPDVEGIALEESVEREAEAMESTPSLATLPLVAGIMAAAVLLLAVGYARRTGSLGAPISEM